MSGELRGLIERLNPICRQALEAAARRAVGQGNRTVEIEHLLVEVLAAGDTDLRALLRHYDVDPTTLEADLTTAIQGFATGGGRTPTLSPDLTGLLRRAWMLSSVDHGLTRIRSGTVLRALLEEAGLAEALAAGVPALAKLDRHALAQDLPRLLDHTAEAETAAAQTGAREGEGEGEAARQGRESAIAAYTRDLTADARAGRLDPVIGREREIAQSLDVLMRRRQNNPILLGAPGVGKTAVVEGLARRIAEGDVPPQVRHSRLLVLDLGQMKAGAGVRGEFEKRLKGLVAEIARDTTPTILFVDEAHTLIGAGGAEGQGDAANMLKPALARGDLRMIGATTWREYKRYIEKDPALSRRFQPVKIPEPGHADAVAMLRGVAESLEQHHDVRLDETAIHAAVTLSDRYIPARQLPDKAISVLDTACARVAMSQSASPSALTAAERAHEATVAERDRLDREGRLGTPQPERIAALTTELERLEAERARLRTQAAREADLLAELRGLEKTVGHRPLDAGERQRLDSLRGELAALQGSKGLRRAHVDADAVAEVIAGWTGIPLDRLMQGDVEAVRSLDADLGARVVGQTQATDLIARHLRVSAARLNDPGRPLGTFLLVGPTGVGKTETARSLSELMFGGSDHMVTINMSEYQEPHSIAGLKGAPPGYVGYGTGGVLTEAVRRTPYNVVLLDEFEKAHQDVWELFYQVFDSGTLEDSEGERVDFSNTIILATTNAGAEVIADAEAAGTVDRERLLAHLDPILGKVFQPALLGRMTVVPYLPLNEVDIGRIVDQRVARLRRQVADTYGATLSLSEEARTRIAALAATAGSAGAREIHRVIEGRVLPEVSTGILDRLAKGQRVGSIAVALAGDDFVATITEADRGERRSA